MARWTSRYDRLARDTSCRDQYLLACTTRIDGLALLKYGYEKSQVLEVDLYVQQDSDKPWSRAGLVMTSHMTYLPCNWEQLPVQHRAALLLHELVHNRQRRKYWFGARWAWSARFRTAMELQAHRESVAAYALLGLPRGWVMETIAHYCSVFHETYRTNRVRVNIASYLLDAYEEAENRLK